MKELRKFCHEQGLPIWQLKRALADTKTSKIIYTLNNKPMAFFMVLIKWVNSMEGYRFWYRINNAWTKYYENHHQ